METTISNDPRLFTPISKANDAAVIYLSRDRIRKTKNTMCGTTRIGGNSDDCTKVNWFYLLKKKSNVITFIPIFTQWLKIN